jgi:hypothetical protein
MKADTDTDELQEEKFTRKAFWERGLKPFFKAIWELLKTVNQRWNEAYLIVIGIVLWKYSGVVLAWIDPGAALPAHSLMRFLYATIGTFTAHFVVSLMVHISHPYVFRYLYGKFYEDLYIQSPDLKSTEIKYNLRCLRLKYSLMVLGVYLVTWLILAATY